MILGMSPLLFVHVVLSLIGIAAGLVVLYGLLTGKPHGGWTAVFLATTVLTSVTGFPLPATQLLLSHIVGALSLVLLAVAIAALYVYDLAGAWRWIYVASALRSISQSARWATRISPKDITKPPAKSPPKALNPICFSKGITFLHPVAPACGGGRGLSPHPPLQRLSRRRRFES